MPETKTRMKKNLLLLGADLSDHEFEVLRMAWCNHQRLPGIPVKNLSKTEILLQDREVTYELLSRCTWGIPRNNSAAKTILTKLKALDVEG